MKYELGFHTNCRCGKTLHEILQNLQAANFKHVMLDAKSEDLESGIKLAQSMGFSVPFVHLPFRKPYGHNVDNFWRKGVENDKLVDSIIDFIKICDRLGVEVAIVHPSNGTKGITWDLGQGLASIRKILDATKHCNVKLAFENGFHDVNQHLYHVLDNIDDERVGFCYDCGHHYLYAPEVDLLGKYGNRCFAVHLHDNMMNPGKGTSSCDLHLLPFDGKIDFARVMSDLVLVNYDGIILLESKHHRAEVGLYVYDKLSPVEFLQLAYQRGEQLIKLMQAGNLKIRQ